MKTDRSVALRSGAGQTNGARLLPSVHFGTGTGEASTSTEGERATIRPLVARPSTDADISGQIRNSIP